MVWASSTKFIFLVLMFKVKLERILGSFIFMEKYGKQLK